nr:hypothetical protein [uncultured Celeribacter sp.]
MKKVPKPTTDDALIEAYLAKGGKIQVGKTKPMPPELGLSKNVWGAKLTKEEKAARDAPASDKNSTKPGKKTS